MYVNELRLSQEEQQNTQDMLVNRFARSEEFPLKTYDALDDLCNLYGHFGQRIVYRSLVEALGRDKVIQNLGKIFKSEEFVRMQIGVLCPEEQ